MEHKGTVRIETDRLILRRLEKNDAVSMFHNWSNDAEVTKFLRWPANKEVKQAEQIIEMWTVDYENLNFYQWGIVPKSLGEPIGTISVVGIDEKAEKVEIGYCIGRKWWHQGYMSEAFAAIIKFLFEEVHANRIEAMHEPKNPNSGKVMEKCGLRYEAILKEAGWSNSGRCDLIVHRILASEYFSERV